MTEVAEEFVDLLKKMADNPANMPSAQALANSFYAAQLSKNKQAIIAVEEMTVPAAMIGILHQSERIADAMEDIVGMLRAPVDEGEDWK